MEGRPLFNSPEQAISVSFNMLSRLIHVVSWCLVWPAHLTVGLLVGALLWALDIRAQEAAAAIQMLAATKPVAFAAAAGVSALGLFAGYWKLCRWAAAKQGSGWLLAYLMRDVSGG